jgi:hypothetical protein
MPVVRHYLAFTWNDLIRALKCSISMTGFYEYSDKPASSINVGIS